MRANERPPPHARGGDPLIERLPDRLERGLNDNHPPPQVPRERLAYLAKAIHSLGERPLLELLIELERGAELRPTLEKYARIAPLADFIEAWNGDCLPLPKVVAGRRA